MKFIKEIVFRFPIVALVPYLILLILSSCKQNEKARSTSSHAKYLIREVPLALDDSTSNEFHYTQYYQEGSEEYLVTLNTLTYTVDKYSLSSGEMVKRTKIPMGGPDGVTGRVLQGLTYSSPDSIFVFVKGNINGSICIDEDGNFVHKLTPDRNKSIDHGLINHVSTVPNPTFKSGNKLHFVRYSLGDNYNPSEFNKQFPITLEYNIETNELTYDSLNTYPDLYLDKIWPFTDTDYSRTAISDSLYLISWPLMDSLVVFDKKNNAINHISAQSKYFKSAPQDFKIRPTEEQDNELVLSNYRYGDVHYDRYNKLIYRIVLHPLKDYKNKTAWPAASEQDFSIIVMDERFEIIHEVDFPGSQYSSFLIIPSKAGLMLFRNNIYDETVSEDELAVEIFDLSKPIQP
ncbi:DUF4221 domain-containing protein [Algoriphagus sp. AGSA1]|uniref:DUF4221 family protein n=1 Tax=Algoriphagus sp. AGSA1 TaxID=2907213 RepID=UPI001F26FBA9|nr:DUF4221 family protein [Algoriphagus sp. AGSA1]MCE7054935.1 DUF4221 domain-containing protein [Algoriphagus sp. AGSA1]